jgi:hypothetical protein
MGRRKSKKAEEKQSKKRFLGPGKLLFLLVVGGIGALVLSEPLRNKALDVLFGAEEEFQYTPPASTSTPENGASAT